MTTERQQYWLDIANKVEAMTKQGKTIKQACIELNVARQTFGAWKQLLQKKGLLNGNVKVIEYKSAPKIKIPATPAVELNAAVFTASQVHALLREFVK